MPEKNEGMSDIEVIEEDDQEVNEKSPFKPSPTFLDGDGEQAKDAMRKVLGFPVDQEDE